MQEAERFVVVRVCLVVAHLVVPSDFNVRHFRVLRTVQTVVVQVYVLQRFDQFSRAGQPLGRLHHRRLPVLLCGFHAIQKRLDGFSI